VAVSGQVIYCLVEGMERSGQWNMTDPRLIAVALDIATGEELWTFAVGNDTGWGIGIGPSLSLAGQVVYFCAAHDDGRIYALDAVTGKELWAWVFSTEPGLVQSSPAVSKGAVYFSGSDGYLYALE
jgi:outer membrane protein assembly factor BamB